MANRNRFETEHMIGFSGNSSNVRVRIPDESSFVELVQEVRSLTLNTRAHAALLLQK